MHICVFAGSSPGQHKQAWCLTLPYFSGTNAQLSRGVAASSGVRETRIHAMLKFNNKTLYQRVKWYDAPVNDEDKSSGWDEEKAASARQQRSYLTILNVLR